MAPLLAHVREASGVSNIRQTSSPERTRSLPNRDLDLGYEHLAMEPTSDLALIGRLEKQAKCLDKIRAGLLDRGTLARDIQLRTERDETVVFALDYGGHPLQLGHASSLTFKHGGDGAPCCKQRLAIDILLVKLDRSRRYGCFGYLWRVS